MLTGRKLPLILAFAVLVVLAFGVSCNGFFTDPTLTSLAISPATPTIPVCTTVSVPCTTFSTKQFTAVGTFSDNTSSTVQATWSSSASTTFASIDENSGLATAIAPGQATITATSVKFPGISNTTTLTVVPNVTSITVQPGSQSTTTAAGFTLTAKDQSGNDISSLVTWNFTVSGTTVTGITGTPGASGGEVFTIGTLNPAQTPPYTIDAVASVTVNGTTISATAVTISVTG